ncbi:MAG: DUF2946 family protein [Aquisalinus sp.]|nr:DUF2946 family protein [Aquisalinus sp.]
MGRHLAYLFVALFVAFQTYAATHSHDFASNAADHQHEHHHIDSQTDDSGAGQDDDYHLLIDCTVCKIVSVQDDLVTSSNLQLLRSLRSAKVGGTHSGEPWHTALSFAHARAPPLS